MKIAAVMFLGLALLGLGIVRADASAPATGKIGFIDLQRTLLETKVGKTAQARFEKKKKEKQAKLDKKQADFQKQLAELNKQRSLMKPEVAAAKQRELEKQYVQIQQTYSQLERELSEEQAKLIQEVLAKAAPIIKGIAKRDGYTLILDRNAILWGADGVDLTDQLNKKIR